MPYVITLAIAALLFTIARIVPLGPWKDPQVSSGYGAFDNRRLLLTWAALLAAAMIGPGLAWLIRRKRRGSGARRPDPLAPAAPHRRNYLVALIVAALTCVLLIGPGVAYRALNGHELVHLGYLNEINHGKILNVDTRVTCGPCSATRCGRS